MADAHTAASRRVPGPATTGLYTPTHIMNDASRLIPSPKVAHSERRNSKHMRRSSLEPVLEGEVRSPDIRRHSVGHDTRGSQPKLNLAKPRVHSSRRSSHGNNQGHRRDFAVRGESLLSAEVRTNVVVCKLFGATSHMTL
jgi:hypothetical protein